MQQGIGQLPDEIDNSLTVMYILIHVTLSWPEEFSATKEALGMYNWVMSNAITNNCSCPETKPFGIPPFNRCKAPLG
jgi:hypothetical protein